MTLNRGVVAMCAAQACAQIGAFSVAALLPTLIAVWSLSHTEAGWISGIYYAAYTLVVPLLSSLTDRVDPKRVYLGSVALTAIAFAGFAWVATGFWSALAFRALMGAGWAGSYMPGLKALSDLAEGSQQSRAVAAHAAAVGVSGALSFGVAGAVNAWLGWHWALIPGALGAVLAFVLVWVGLPSRPPPAAAGPRRALLDFRPILRNRSALAYSVAYGVHTWEMSALRGWVVTFLTFVAARAPHAWIPLAPATVASVMALLGVWASVWGNELAIRFGRRRFILGTMLASGVLAAVIGFSAALPYAAAAALVLLYAILIWSDSSSLTAGSAGSAEPGRRGATLAVHSTLGYAGGFLGPLALGALLDLVGGASVLGWGVAFGHVTVALLLGALVFVWLRPADLVGDRSLAPATAAAPALRSRSTTTNDQEEEDRAAMSPELLPIAVIGAGPVGLAAAAQLVSRGEIPIIFEAGAEVGAAVREWAHVRVFSPWRYNVDPVAAAMLAKAGWIAPDPDHLPTGQELVADYLAPLAALPEIAPSLRLGTRVLSVSRRGVDKLRTDGRERAPFVLRLRTPAGEEEELLARAVIDASGTSGSPNPLGADGIPARGEAGIRDRVFYGIPDVLGAQRDRYAARRVAVVGSGHSALNSLLDLVELRASAPATEIVWIVRRPLSARVFGGGVADALPARGALGQQARQLLERGLVRLVVGRIAAVTRTARGVTIQDEGGATLAVADELVAVTGLRPDLSPLRELRLDLDPIMEAPRALAPLIDPNVHSCGTVPPHGIEELTQPEAGFFVVGMKSYGRAPTFLMLTGYEQVRSIACALTGDMPGARRVELTLPATGVCSAQPTDTPVVAGVAAEPATSCCGGPAPVGLEACCVQDAEAKAEGHHGCGCGSETVASTVGAEASGPATRAPTDREASRRTLLPIAAPRREPRAASCCDAGDAVVRDEGVRDLVKEKYGQVAVRVATGGTSCCGSTTSRGGCDPVTSNLYGSAETADLPREAVAASLGCGNPTALAELKPGETVLDLGSGGGIDVLLSARRVGPTGKAYGLDMTDEMLALARENQRKAGVTNVEFLKGEIEHIPLPGDSVDVIISNCVINLSADKDAVLAEAFRVLKPGGRFAVSDVVVRGDVPSEIRRSVELWIGCVAGALEESEYRAKLAKAGFDEIDVEPTRIYTVEDARELVASARLGAGALAAIDGKFISAFVRARKPGP